MAAKCVDKVPLTALETEAEQKRDIKKYYLQQICCWNATDNAVFTIKLNAVLERQQLQFKE